MSKDKDKKKDKFSFLRKGKGFHSVPSLNHFHPKPSPPPLKPYEHWIGPQEKKTKDDKGIFYKDKWLDGFSESSRNQYERVLEEFISFSKVEGDNLKLINQNLIESYRDSLLNRSMPPGTIKVHLTAISSFCGHLLKEGVLKGENPAKKVSRPKVDINETKAPPLSLEQAKAMLNKPDTTTLQGLRDRVILYLIFYNYLPQKICDFKVRDFDSSKGTLYGEEINPTLKNVLSAYLNNSDHQKKMDFPLIYGQRGEGLEGKHLDKSQIIKIFYKYRDEVGLPEKVNTQSARTTCRNEAKRIKNELKKKPVRFFSKYVRY